MSTEKPRIDRVTVLTLAARAECDVRTARRILSHGVDGVRGEALRDRATRVLAEMGIELTTTSGRAA